MFKRFKERLAEWLIAAEWGPPYTQADLKEVLDERDAEEIANEKKGLEEAQ